QDTLKKRSGYDAQLPPWCIDINLKGGMMTQDAGKFNLAGSYLNYISSTANVSDIKFKTGSTFGVDAQIGYFFGKSRHFGIGAGFMYLSNAYDVTLDNFKIEYQSSDYANRTYRQVITANGPIKEKVNATNINIPVVLKYKNQFGKHWGFTADAGILYNTQITNKYSTDASFNYEAIYKYVVQDGVTPTAVYDNAPTPDANDLIWKKDYILTKNPNANVVDSFNHLYAAGYNVGLNKKANVADDKVNYTTGSIGFIFQPSISYLISDHVALSLGGFLTYQTFNSGAYNSKYQITDRVGEYHSMMKSVNTTNQTNIGANLGLRVYFGKMKDRDHDGIADKRDNCPDVPGLKFFHGCPDRDGDSIIDNEDQCPDVKGLAKFHGCPDRDGDGIIDKDDLCPDQPGPLELHGCPDRDGDGIADKDDQCPDVKGLEAFHGCPDTDGDGISDNNDACPTEAGPTETNGCPDRDKDGVIDSKDKCPDVPGPASNDGCPEVTDSTDIPAMVLFETNTA
ncbi:MAG: hypothetical protein EBZ77_14875, partial [Chitinophagia bacterium]|nr:hypothetical protein [Chitinophagia bacterium]